MIHDLFLRGPAAARMTGKLGTPKVLWRRAIYLTAPLPPLADQYGRQGYALRGAPQPTSITVTDYPNVDGIGDASVFEVW